MADATPLDFARQVRQRHRDELLGRFQAVGLGISKQDENDGGGYVIVVYLDSERERPQAPVSIEGVPVRFEVTGQVRPLAASTG